MADFHPGDFNFGSQNIRVDAATISGGQALSGYEDVIITDGGGMWFADFSGADFGDASPQGRIDTNNWRAINAYMTGGRWVDVVFCERIVQPVPPDYAGSRVPHSDDTPFSDDTYYVTAIASATTTAAAALRATSLSVGLTALQSLIGGERFTIEHSERWGARAYEVLSVSGGTITFQPPLREAVDAGVLLDFVNVRCRMRRVSAPDNSLAGGRWSSASIGFVEFMQPVVS